MKKGIALSLFFVLSYSFIFCQTKKNSISFSIGPSWPISNYGSSDLSNDNAGVAKLGEHINFSFEHKINNSFSVSATLYAQRHSLNTKAFETQFSNRIYYYGLSTGGSPLFIPVVFPNWKFKKDKWLSAGLLIGGINEFPIFKKRPNFSINIKAMVGLVYSVSPNLYGSSTTDTTFAKQTITSKSAIGFNYLFGTGLKYNITPKYYFLFDLQYLATNELKFKNVTQTFTGEINPTTVNGVVWQNSFTGNSTQTLSTINFNVGVGIHL